MKQNDTVSWTETYRTVSGVVAQATHWGTVVEVVTKPGDSDGFPMQGDYARIIPTTGGAAIFVHAHDLTSVIKAA